MDAQRPLIPCSTIRRESTSAMRLVPNPTNKDFEALMKIVKFFSQRPSKA